MSGGLTGIFTAQHNGTPLWKIPMFEIDKGGIDTTPYSDNPRCINIQNVIIEKGVIPIATEVTSDKPYYKPYYSGETPRSSQRVDFEADDAFANSLRFIQKSCIARVDQSKTLSGLLDKRVWGIDDRKQWEEGIANIVSAEVDFTPGLGSYFEGGKRPIDLNDMAEDFEQARLNGEGFRPEHEVECEVFSFVEGVMLQKLDNHFLPEGSEGHEFKQPTNYYYTRGHVNMNSINGMSSGAHTFVVSPFTMSVFETTADHSKGQDPYWENTNPEHSFEKFVLGNPAVWKPSSVSGAYDYAVYGAEIEKSKAYGLIKEAMFEDTHKPPQFVQSGQTFDN